MSAIIGLSSICWKVWLNVQLKKAILNALIEAMKLLMNRG